MALLLQLVRIPVLVALLLLTGPPQERMFRAVSRLEIDATWGPWAWMAVLGIVFCVLALAGRGERQSRLVLAAEGLAAAILALPPVAWVQWVGLHWFPRALGAATGHLFATGLAVAWLVIVAMSLTRVLRVSLGPTTET